VTGRVLQEPCFGRDLGDQADAGGASAQWTESANSDRGNEQTT
jgi:hypothetical protein